MSTITHYFFGGRKLANHKSALKRARQNTVKNERNTSIRSKLKTFIKKLRTAIEEKDKEKSEGLLKTVSRELDKAVTKNVVHKNCASRKTSKLAKQVNSI